MTRVRYTSTGGTLQDALALYSRLRPVSQAVCIRLLLLEHLSKAPYKVKRTNVLINPEYFKRHC